MSFFITLEGPDGSGKTSQATYLADFLGDRNMRVLLTREPGGTVISDQIRHILMNLKNTAMDPHTEFLLFSAARAQHVREIIRPHLDSGGIVVCDRFFDSSLAYQGFGQGLNLETLKEITAFATGGLIPDLTILLDLPCEVGLNRRKEGGSWNRLDAYEVDFHQRVRRGYLLLVKDEPERWEIVDAERDPEIIRLEIQDIICRRLDLE